MIVLLLAAQMKRRFDRQVRGSGGTSTSLLPQLLREGAAPAKPQTWLAAQVELRPPVCRNSYGRARLLPSRKPGSRLRWNFALPFAATPTGGRGSCQAANLVAAQVELRLSAGEVFSFRLGKLDSQRPKFAGNSECPGLCAFAKVPRPV